MLKKFFIWLIKSLIVLVLFTLIFSTVTLDLPNLTKGISSDIFQYASPEMQKEVIEKLALACPGLEEKGFDALQQMPDSPMPLNSDKIGALCKDYADGKVNGKEFLFGFIENAFPEKLELPKVDALEKYNNISYFLNKNKMIYFAALLILLAALYLLLMDVGLFILILSGISFRTGILILAPYFAIIMYDKFVGIDTTPLLAAVFSGDISFDAKALISISLLMVLRMYSNFIIMLGILFFGVGIAGKAYSFMSKRKEKTAEIKPKKETAKEKVSKTKRSSGKDDKKDEENEKITKEALDELEEMQKKKSKKN